MHVLPCLVLSCLVSLSIASVFPSLLFSGRAFVRLRLARTKTSPSPFSPLWRLAHLFLSPRGTPAPPSSAPTWCWPRATQLACSPMKPPAAAGAAAASANPATSHAAAAAVGAGSAGAGSSGSGSGSGGDEEPPAKRTLKRQLTKHVVTRWYRAPELILLQVYTCSCVYVCALFEEYVPAGLLVCERCWCSRRGQDSS